MKKWMPWVVMAVLLVGCTDPGPMEPAPSDKYKIHGDDAALKAIHARPSNFSPGGEPPDRYVDWGKTGWSRSPDIIADSLYAASLNEATGRGGYISGKAYIIAAFDALRSEWDSQNPGATPEFEEELGVKYDQEFYYVTWNTFHITELECPDPENPDCPDDISADDPSGTTEEGPTEAFRFEPVSAEISAPPTLCVAPYQGGIGEVCATEANDPLRLVRVGATIMHFSATVTWDDPAWPTLHEEREVTVSCIEQNEGDCATLPTPLVISGPSPLRFEVPDRGSPESASFLALPPGASLEVKAHIPESAPDPLRLRVDTHANNTLQLEGVLFLQCTLYDGSLAGCS